MLSILFFILGLIIGSFLNVVIYRVRSGEGGIATGRSHCRRCKKDLAWYDNVPVVSYCVLRGKCRYCEKVISPQYPVVEIATASVFALLAFFVSQGPLNGYTLATLVLTCGVFASLIVIFVYDAKYMEVPMTAVWIGMACAVAIVVLADIQTPVSINASQSVWHAVSAGCAFFFFFSLSYVSKETWMGYGDGFVALVIGALLGPAATFLALLIAVWSGAVVGIIITVIQKSDMKTAIPFGPFLVLGAFSAFVIMHVMPSWLHIFW